MIKRTREHEALRHLSHGLGVRAIAARLGVSEPAVRANLWRAVKKLKAKNQLHAVAIAIRRRLI